MVEVVLVVMVVVSVSGLVAPVPLLVAGLGSDCSRIAIESVGMTAALVAVKLLCYYSRINTNYYNISYITPLTSQHDTSHKMTLTISQDDTFISQGDTYYLTR